LCGSAYRSDVEACLDCGLDLVPPDADQRRVRELVDARLDRRAFERIRPALAVLADVLVEGEAIGDLTDARHAGRAGVVAVTTQALCWVPAVVEPEAGAIALDTIQRVDTWPGDGGQLRVDVGADLHIFTGVGGASRLGEFAEALRNAMRSRALQTWRGPDGGVGAAPTA
jgi:hypothetical protein